ncbi:hypothetical protein FRACYDRAFT_245128 [Fragilariopsis cylindrus CCMP1102]|uniref:Uncharacterized protein n=1 Tax=Fragilariopsis cylindrus CCMP1102 TaxID=635003 RepID=A0A1E7F1D6_9STRA|nr:hypothetical protein FRACYDRAFT_245128 [Fragilariopsis cylindrus CCMP1102]|eukprot:OEU12002.1 hypothetical protein FRACYDRAFT_245128 [Fragilariopsis cylindrus CCMP1102]
MTMTHKTKIDETMTIRPTVTTMEMEMHVQMIHEFLGYNNTGSNDNSSNDTGNESNDNGNNEQEQDQDDQIDLLVDQEEDQDDQIQIDLLVNELPTLNACILFLKLTEYICYNHSDSNNNNVHNSPVMCSGVKPNVIRKSIELWRDKNNNSDTTGGISVEKESMINELICNAVKRSDKSDDSNSSSSNSIQQIATAMETISLSLSLKHPIDTTDTTDTTTTDTTDTTDIENEIKKAHQKLVQKLVKELDYELNIPQKDDERLIQNFHNTICIGRRSSKSKNISL